MPEQTDPLPEEDRRVVRRREREEQTADRRQSDEHDRGHAALRRERRALVLEREPATHQRRDARKAATDAPSAARERGEHDRERRDVLVGNDAGVSAERLADRCAKRERRGGATGRRGEAGRQRRCDLRQRDRQREPARERRGHRVDQRRQGRACLAGVRATHASGDASGRFDEAAVEQRRGKRGGGTERRAASSRRDAPQLVVVSVARDQLGDLDDAAATILAALLMHDEIDAAPDLLADRGKRQVHTAHERHRLDAEERVIRAVRVRGRERSAVAGVHRLEHVERLAAADLADDDAIGPHPKRGPQQRAHVDGTRPLDARRSRLERDDVRLRQTAARPRPRS